MKHLRAAVRFAAILGLMAATTVAQVLIMAPLLRDKNRAARLAAYTTNKFLNIDVEVKGNVDRKLQAINVANHQSHLDAMVMTSIFDAASIGMREIAKWPVIGPVVKYCFDTILIRRSKEHNGHAHYKMVDALNQGRSINVYPEGKCSDGTYMRQFRAGMLRPLFNQAVDRDGKKLTVEPDVVVQPVAIRLVEVDGRDATSDQSLRDRYCWHDDHKHKNYLSHMWQVMTTRSMKLEVTILPALNPKDFTSPEDLANKAHDMIHEAVFPGKPVTSAPVPVQA
jgi:1-acyl-sn-glycerol-3-phosphate acyltransferase